MALSLTQRSMAKSKTIVNLEDIIAYELSLHYSSENAHLVIKLFQLLDANGILFDG